MAPEPAVSQAEVRAYHEEGLRHRVSVRQHGLTADEPESAGGTDQGPTPMELLFSGLASCTAMTIRLYAGHKGWDIGDCEVTVTRLDDAAPAAGGSKPRPRVEVDIRLDGDLAHKQIERIRDIAEKCPVARAISGGVVVDKTVCRIGSGGESDCV